MKKNEIKIETKSWTEIKDAVYGEKGTELRDQLDRDFESFKIGLLLRKARGEKILTQEQLSLEDFSFSKTRKKIKEYKISLSDAVIDERRREL